MKPDNNKNDFVRKNEQIRHHQVLVVQDGKKLGVFSSRDAQMKARQAGLDLVEVAPNGRPPVCAIIDYGKYMYDKTKCKKSNSSNAVKEKEIAFRYAIDHHDLETKINQAKKFLAKGDRVKLIVKFKGRENAHKDQGWEVIREALEMLKDVAIIDRQPSMDGSSIIAKVVSNGKLLDPKPAGHDEELKISA